MAALAVRSESFYIEIQPEIWKSEASQMEILPANSWISCRGAFPVSYESSCIWVPPANSGSSHKRVLPANSVSSHIEVIPHIRNQPNLEPSIIRVNPRHHNRINQIRIFRTLQFNQRALSKP